MLQSPLTFTSNEWDPMDARPVVHLFEAWLDFIPPFIRDNILDQLILPKVSSVIGRWKLGVGAVPLHMIIFPWFPLIGARYEQFVEDAKRKLKSTLRSWRVLDGIPPDFLVWKDVCSRLERSVSLLTFFSVVKTCRFLALKTGIRFSSNTSSLALGLLSVTVLSSIHNVRTWNFSARRSRGALFFVLRSSVNVSKQNFSPNGSTLSMHGSLNLRVRTQKLLIGTSSGKTASRRTCSPSQGWNDASR